MWKEAVVGVFKVHHWHLHGGTGIWKEAVVGVFKVHHWHLHGGTVYGRKQLWVCLRYITGICMEGLVKLQVLGHYNGSTG
jgi:hypothetical protein